ncbi:MAG: DNA modification methylase [Patescibacteria group bacterium]
MAKQKLEWRTERRKVKDLIRYEKNPRKLSATQLDGLKRSLKKFNVAELPCINTDGTLVAGNQRVLALSLLGRGEEEIEVRVPNRTLTDEEFKDYLLTSNRSGASWDFEKLAAEFNLDELLTAGFDSFDLSNIFDDNLEVEDDEIDIEKEIKEAQTTDIKSGDRFLLGTHTLICADSTDPETVHKLVGENRIDLINIDYPYNIGVDYSAGLGGKQNYGGTTNDKKTDAEYEEFLASILTNAISVTKKDAHIFTWLDEKYIGTMQNVFKTTGVEFKRLCLWAKNSHNPTPKIAFNRAVELCMYGVKGKPFLSDKIKNLTEFQNKEIASGNRLIDDILDMFNIWLVKRLPSSDYLHPTMKPPTLYEKSIRRCSRPGDAVLDLTAGSGSLMVACEALKRRAYLAEIEPVFCQVIINRFKKISNEKIIKLN